LRSSWEGIVSTKTLTEALTAALAALDSEPKDGAAVQLAKTYAAKVDADGDLSKFGPLLLAALESLGMTPRGRAAILGKGGEQRGKPKSTADELRERRAKRAG
jgi:hypothetical protein